MPVSKTGKALLSSLRRTRSRAALFEIPPVFFDDGEERNAFMWLRNYVQQYNAWPSASTFTRETHVQAVITNEPLAYYQNDARRKALFQTLHTPYADIKKALQRHDPDEAIQIMRQVMTASAELNFRREGLITLSESLNLVEQDYDIAKNTPGLRGIPTGWEFLDTQTDGWQPADLITVVGRTGRGKTMTLLKMAHAAREAGHSVLFLSMEMAVLQLTRRYFGLHTQINPRFLRHGRLGTHAEAEMRRQKALLQDTEVPLWWLAGNFKKTVPALKAAVYETQADIIFADASYLLKPENKGKYGQRRELIADVIEEISSLGKEVNRPIVQSTQLNRQAVKPKRGEEEQNQNDPVSHLTLERIGETDVVGQNSAVVLGIELGDPPHENDERYMKIMKGREGEHGWFRYHYKFQPVNLDYITDNARQRIDGGAPIEAPDTSFMDTEV